MNRDEENLNLLAIFHYVLGGLVLLGSCLALFCIGMGIAMLSGAFDGKNAPPNEMGWIFVVIGSVAMVIGWTIGVLIIMAGQRLKQRTSRVFCLVVAGLECLINPLGPILAVFTIVMLMKESVIQLFEANQQVVGEGEAE